MNAIGRIFKMPWLASFRTAQSWLLLFIWFTLAVDISMGLPLHHASQRYGVAILMVAMLAIWKMVANTLWLARDARALRLPAVERDADSTLPLFALISVVLPALILGSLFGNPVLWLVSLALLAAGTLALLILPTVVVIPVYVVGSLSLAFDVWHLPLPGDPAYFAWAVPALIVLTVASLQRWIAIRRAVTLELTPLWRPTLAGSRLVQLRKLRDRTYHASDVGHGKKPRTSTCATLNRVGPDHPIRSIQAALGEYLKPFDLVADSARYKRLQLLFTALVLTLPFFALLAQHYLGMTVILRHTSLLLLWMAIGTTFSQIGKSGYPLAACWSPRSSDLPLLALLPRLSNTACVRRDTLAAGAMRALLVKCLFALSFLLALAALKMPAMSYLYLALMFLCGALSEIALAAGIVGGKPLGKFAPRAFGWSALIPTVTTMSLGIRTVDAHPIIETFDWQALVCIALWLAWCGGFGLLTLRGWRALLRRPHPFLPNPPT